MTNTIKVLDNLNECLAHFAANPHPHPYSVPTLVELSPDTFDLLPATMRDTGEFVSPMGTVRLKANASYGLKRDEVIVSDLHPVDGVLYSFRPNLSA